MSRMTLAAMRDAVACYAGESIRSGMNVTVDFTVDNYDEETAVRLHVHESGTLACSLQETLLWVRVGDDHWQAVRYDQPPLSVARAEPTASEDVIRSRRCGLCDEPTGWWIVPVACDDGGVEPVAHWVPCHATSEGVLFCDDCVDLDDRLTTGFIGFE